MITLSLVSLVFFFCCFIGLSMATYDMARRLRGDATRVALLVLLMGCAIGVLLLLRSAYKRFLRWLPNATATLFEQGLVYDGIVLRWVDLREVTIGIQQVNVKSGFVTVAKSREHRLTLKDSHGQIISLYESLPGTERIADVARRVVFENVIPIASAQLAKGEVVQFAANSVGADGVLLGGKQVPWQEVTGIEVRDGLLIVKRRRRFPASEWLSRIPNCDVMIALLRQRVQAEH